MNPTLQEEIDKYMARFNKNWGGSSPEWVEKQLTSLASLATTTERERWIELVCDSCKAKLQPINNESSDSEQ